MLKGTIHSNARLVHEKRTRLRTRLLDHIASDIQRPSRASRADSPRQRHGRCSHGSSRQQIRSRQVLQQLITHKLISNQHKT